MPSFKLYTSNKPELLLDALADVVAGPLQSPLAQEQIIVQSKAMEQWLSMQLARKLGIWANCSFYFPNSFIEYVFQLAFPDLREHDVQDPRFFTWKIMSVLPSLVDRQEFELIKTYLSDGHPIKVYELASLIADTFDQYTLYRPSMVRQWDRGNDDHWQAVLWRTLYSSREPLNRASLKERLLSRISDKSFSLYNGVERISLFGVSSLPVFHLEIINGLSSLIDVHLFLLNPCSEFWDDIVSEKEIHKRTMKRDKQRFAKRDGHWEQGNQLLALWGGYGRDFLSCIHDLDVEDCSLASRQPEEPTVLATIQEDIVRLRQRSLKTELRTGDYSIQVHSCHTPMREIEVLFDNVLLLFGKIPGLSPADIVVMAPDMASYAPWVHAVFGAIERDRISIPYHVVDGAIDSDPRVVATFLSLFSLAKSRLSAGEVVSLLGSQPLQSKYNVSDDEVELIRTWVSETHICWGLDEEHREFHGVPGFPENTWKSGVDQMVLGYAMLEETGKTFEGIAPYNGIEDGQVEVLGRFLDFFTRLTELIKNCSRKQTIEEWVVASLRFLDDFFKEDDDNSREFQLIRDAVHELIIIADQAGFHTSVDCDTFRYDLTAAIGKSRAASSYFSGKMTFCEMLPMHGIPFKVVYLVGMNDTAFPRISRHPSWDLIATGPKKGDRSLEREDRYLFLTSMLCAERAFIVSYCGRDRRDNSLCQPSIVVSELLEYIDAGFVLPGCSGETEQSLRGQRRNGLLPSEQLHVQHRLQAFHHDYFTPGSRLHSFSEEQLSIARMIAFSVKERAPFFTKEIDGPSPDQCAVDLQDIFSFFSNPIRFLLKNRIGISLEIPENTFGDKEPFSIEGLYGYTIGRILVDLFLKGENRESSFAFLKAKGLLPHGNPGICAFQSAANEVTRYIDSLRSITKDEALTGIWIQGRIGGCMVAGRIDGVAPESLVHHRFAYAKPRDKLKLWISTLALAALAPDFYRGQSVFVVKDGTWEIPRIENANELLSALLDLYRSGLSWPLPFFTNTSWTYAESMTIDDANPGKALLEAQKIWEGNDYQRGEKEDPYYSLCFGDGSIDPLDERFEKVSMDIVSAVCSIMRKVQ